MSGAVRVKIFGLGCVSQLISHGGKLGQGGGGGGGGGGGRVTDAIVVGSGPVETGGQPLRSWFCSTNSI